MEDNLNIDSLIRQAEAYLQSWQPPEAPPRPGDPRTWQEVMDQRPVKTSTFHA